jgi:hypothetical protein
MLTFLLVLMRVLASGSLAREKLVFVVPQLGTFIFLLVLGPISYSSVRAQTYFAVRPSQ